MRLSVAIFRGATVLSITQMAGQLCSLCRNIIVARIVSPADFGIAAIFLMIVSFLEMISNFSFDRLLVQAEDGNVEKFQHVAQFMQFLKVCKG